MPAVSLTQVKKKDREWKEGLVSQIQRQLDTYPTVYLLRYENFRNEAFKSLREKVRDSSTFCLGSNKVLKVALGKSEAEEYRSNLHLLANDMSGNSALLFTRLPQADVERMVDSFEVLDYARRGTSDGGVCDTRGAGAAVRGSDCAHDGTDAPEARDAHKAEQRGGRASDGLYGM